MESPCKELGIARRLPINIRECKHLWPSFLAAARKAASPGKPVTLLECTEEAIPDSQIAEVVLVHIQLVMNGMMLRSLDELAARYISARILAVWLPGWAIARFLVAAVEVDMWVSLMPNVELTGSALLRSPG